MYLCIWGAKNIPIDLPKVKPPFFSSSRWRSLVAWRTSPRMWRTWRMAAPHAGNRRLNWRLGENIPGILWNPVESCAVFGFPPEIWWFSMGVFWSHKNYSDFPHEKRMDRFVWWFWGGGFQATDRMSLFEQDIRCALHSKGSWSIIQGRVMVKYVGTDEGLCSFPTIAFNTYLRDPRELQYQHFQG